MAGTKRGLRSRAALERRDLTKPKKVSAAFHQAPVDGLPVESWARDIVWWARRKSPAEIADIIRTLELVLRNLRQWLREF